MTKTILVPTDFSAASVNAAMYAVNLCKYLHTSLILLHVMPFPIAFSEIPVSAGTYDEAVSQRYQDLQVLEAQLKLMAGDKVDIAIKIKTGSVEQQIEELARREQPMAIVMGMRAEKTLKNAMMGSSVFHVMNHISIPVFVIPQHAAFHPIRKMGIACDLKNAKGDIPFPAVRYWLSVFKVNPDILHIGSVHGDLIPGQINESILIQNQLAVFKPQFHFLKNNDPADELNEFERLNQLDLLMLFPKTHGISELFKIKRGKEIAAHSFVPLLSIHEVPAIR